jgi:hypothetical protein
MNIRRILTATSIALLPVVASAATLIIPAAGTGAGFNQSRWQSELTLHNTSSRTLVVDLTFHDSNGGDAEKTISINPRATQAIQDIVRTQFGLESATGAIVVEVADADASRLAVTSRTFNASAAGTFGQDIPAYRAEEAAAAGDVAVLAGPSSSVADRFNFGVFAVAGSEVTWQLVRADGTIAARKDVTYAANEQKQYNNGVVTLFNSTAADSDTVYAIVKSGKGVFYGSAINQASGDPTFVPAVKAREELRLNFAGIDTNENGSADLLDADHDGVVDTTFEIVTSTFPKFFRVLVTGAANEAATLTVLESPAAYVLLPNNTIQLAPTGELKGTTGALKIRATVGSDTAILTIPVQFK